MRVLVACEYSGRVRDAFAAKGRDLNQQHQENSKHNAAKRRYLAVYVPKFYYT